MPSHLFTQVSRRDLGAVIAFVRSKPPGGDVHPRPRFEEAARQEIAQDLWRPAAADVARSGSQWPPDMGAEHALGRYIVRATCAECHEMNLRGGTPYPGAKPRPDLRLIAAYEPEQFATFMRTGSAVGERELELMSDVARGRYSNLSPREVAAVYAYLRAVSERDP